MESEELIEVYNDKLRGETFTYYGSIIDGTKVKTDIEFNAEIVGIKKYLHAGTPHDYYMLVITITNADMQSKHILRMLEDKIKENPENDFWGFCLGLSYELYSNFFEFVGEHWLKIISIILDFDDEKPQITEGTQSRLFVRNAVKYITDLLKDKKVGDFYDYYDELNKKIGDVGFEIHLRKSRKKDFTIDAEYSPEDDSISLTIEYNPNTVETNLYEIIGVLNEYIEHELTHAKQESEYGLPVKQPKNPFKYYTQPHEIEAQRKGFERLSKLRKLPLDIVAKTWYDTHKDIHGLNDKQVDIILKKVLNF
jgi:hypothetical protein